MSEYSRREFVAGAATGAGTLALADQIGLFGQQVRAQLQSNEPRINLNDSIYIDEVSGEYRVSHDGNGEIFRYDPNDDVFRLWKEIDGGGSAVPVGDDLDLQGSQSLANVDSVGANSVSTETASIANVVGKLRWDSSGSAQTISSGTTTKVVWDVSAIEDSDIVTVSTSSDDITIDDGGTYHISGLVSWRENSNWSTGDSCSVRVYVNGNFKTLPNKQKLGTSAQGVYIQHTDSLSASDSVDLRVRQDSGSDQSLYQGDSNADARGYFTVARLG